MKFCGRPSDGAVSNSGYLQHKRHWMPPRPVEITISPSLAFSHTFANRTPDTMRSAGPVMTEGRLTRIVRRCTHLAHVRGSRE
jgi:hypothetical protein